MSKISEKRIEQIKANVLRLLYDEAPRSLFTSKIADLEARDKQFILKLLLDLEKQKIVCQTKTDFKRKRKWTMTNHAYKAYQELL